MTIDELIDILEKTKKVHPTIKVVQSLNREGKATNSVGVHLLEHTILIKGELT